jgi:lipopolysaccharide/colanic/teichoic acid biosynthesis glycosyltransferase
MKRLFDMLVAAIVLLFTWPIALVVALLVRWSMGTPVLFRQPRPGLGGRLFTLYKFRTMSDARDRDGQLLPDAQRLTRVGRFIRSTSLDEWPQMLHVLTGDMSLVGPRPLLPEYLPRYSAHHARRHEVRPGITGWAQVNGRAALDWDHRLDLDVWYVDHQSFLLDLRILWLTGLRVVQREGITGPGNVPFTGSRARPDPPV